MISVYVLPNGDVAFRCSVCDITTYVQFKLSTSPFWSEYLGDALVRMLGHYMEAHSSVNSLPLNSHSETKEIQGVEYRTRKNHLVPWGEWGTLPTTLLFSYLYLPEEFEFRRTDGP